MVAEGLGPPGHWGNLRSILEHDNVIWLGDLNYRINMGDEDARRLIKANKLEKLLESDQLTREMAAGRVFQVCCGSYCCSVSCSAHIHVIGDSSNGVCCKPSLDEVHWTFFSFSTYTPETA